MEMLSRTYLTKHMGTLLYKTYGRFYKMFPYVINKLFPYEINGIFMYGLQLYKIFLYDVDKMFPYKTT